jgi:hypothetical protein
MAHRLRYILPVVVLLVFGTWMYSDDIPKPDLGAAILNLQSTLSQLQTQIKDLQSSVKELARDAKEAKKASHVTTQPVGAPETASGTKNGESAWRRAQDAYERGRRSPRPSISIRKTTPPSCIADMLTSIWVTSPWPFPI